MLSNRIEGKTPLNILDEIGDLYDLRSDIVHGRGADISYEKVQSLETYLRELVRVFFRLSEHRKRDEILSLVDDSMLDEEHHKELNKLLG